MSSRERIGILTFQHTTNYGASLQAYALCNYLRKNGLEVQIIDYRCEKIEAEYRTSLSRNTSMKAFVKNLLSYSFMNKRKKKFNRYLEEFCSDKVYTKESTKLLDEEFDIFIVGSDQVWNPNLIGEDYTYFLNFATNKKKISYAASFGVEELSDDVRLEMAKLVDDIDHISVRESQGIQLVRDMGISKPVQQVLDPTFLLKKEEWIDQTRQVNRFRDLGNYILVYAQGRPKYGMDFAKALAKKQGGKVVVVHAYARNYQGVINIRDASVEEFLFLIKNASCVVTTSFHGVALSLNMEKQFFYELKENNKAANSRLVSLMETMNIYGRNIDNSWNVEEIPLINYDTVNRILEERIEESKEFLARALKN